MDTAASHKTADSDLPLYVAVSSFLQLPNVTRLEECEADVIISGVPFDLATTGRSGSRFGPEGIRKASVNLMWEGMRWPWDFCLADRLQIEDMGDLSFKHGEPQTLVDNLEAHASRILETGKTMLTFGGDHFITLPLLRAHVARHGPVALIHFDAHTDNYPGSSRYDHGTVFYHAVEEGLLDCQRSIQIGIRTTYEVENHPFEVLDAAWVNDNGPYKVLERIRQRVSDKKAYLSFDIDGLDPAYAPGTGTPVAAGVSIDCALKMIRGMIGLNLIGMDLVEVAPAYDQAEITSLAAATVALEYLYVIAANH